MKLFAPLKAGLFGRVQDDVQGDMPGLPRVAGRMRGEGGVVAFL
ncbi:hypothetical protein C4K37_5721 [Pseudomonas chlororaphis subsp. piscium]|nr:hypothetical protein C4K37_5721 [Pseudomonas chlororaphis subsp. piscium]AZC46630.1 hypothetical protein C4K36_5740 [Pseudomonas chlororaphis subsp. piscium]